MAVWTTDGIIDPFTTVQSEGAFSIGGKTWKGFDATPGSSSTRPRCRAPPCPWPGQRRVGQLRPGRQLLYHAGPALGDLHQWRGRPPEVQLRRQRADDPARGPNPLTVWAQGNTAFSQTAIYNAQVAADSNLPSYNDPSTGQTITDAGSGRVTSPGGRTRRRRRGRSTGTRTRCSSWSRPTAARRSGPPSTVGAGNNNQLPEMDAHPQLTVSQGTADGRIPGGQVTVLYDDIGSARGNSPPADLLFAVSYHVTPSGLAKATRRSWPPRWSWGPPSGRRPPSSSTWRRLRVRAGGGDRLGQHARLVRARHRAGSTSPTSTATTPPSTRVDAQHQPGRQHRHLPRPPTTAAGPGRGRAADPGLVNDDARSGTASPRAPSRRPSSRAGPSSCRRSPWTRPPARSSSATQDTRFDAAPAAVGLDPASIDGGTTFSPATFADAPDRVRREPAHQGRPTGRPRADPGQPVGQHPTAEAAFGLGDRQGLAVFGGQALRRLVEQHERRVGHAHVQDPHRAVDLRRRAAGDLQHDGPGRARDRHRRSTARADHFNGQFDADGTPLADGFVVTFDRPINTGSFTAGRRHVGYRDPSTCGSDRGSSSRSSRPWSGGPATALAGGQLGGRADGVPRPFRDPGRRDAGDRQRRDVQLHGRAGHPRPVRSPIATNSYLRRPDRRQPAGDPARRPRRRHRRPGQRRRRPHGRHRGRPGRPDDPRPQGPPLAPAPARRRPDASSSSPGRGSASSRSSSSQDANARLRLHRHDLRRPGQPGRRQAAGPFTGHLRRASRSASSRARTRSAPGPCRSTTPGPATRPVAELGTGDHDHGPADGRPAQVGNRMDQDADGVGGEDPAGSLIVGSAAGRPLRDPVPRPGDRDLQRPTTSTRRSRGRPCPDGPRAARGRVLRGAGRGG